MFKFALQRRHLWGTAFSFHEPELQLLHASLVRVYNSELELSGKHYRLALDGQVTAGLDYEPGDGLGVIIAELRTELLVEVLDWRYARDEVAAGVDGLDVVSPFLLALVRDVAHDLLQHVLDCYKP